MRGSNWQSSLALLLPSILSPTMPLNLDTMLQAQSANHHPEADTKDLLDVRKIVPVLQPTKCELNSNR